jgi:hypothetical protein
MPFNTAIRYNHSWYNIGTFISNLLYMAYSKTYAAILFVIIGWIGFGEYVTESQIGTVIDLAIQLVGIVWSIWLRYKAGKEGKLDEVNALGFKV